MSSKQVVKALFVGITYTKFPSSTDLGPIPCDYAKVFMDATIRAGIFQPEECYFLSDKKCSALCGVHYSLPTKSNITTLLNRMIVNAKKGDVLLFYFCGHGGKDDANPDHHGFLKTLKHDSGSSAYDVFYDTELQPLLNLLADEVNLTCIFHASNSGAMFIKDSEDPSAYKGKGIALTSVTPNTPVSVEGAQAPPDRADFSVFLQDHVLDVLDKDPKKWPSYDKVLAVVADACKQSPGETKLEPQLYHDPAVDTSKFLFLSSIVDQDKLD